jgi:hypothetical protein
MMREIMMREIFDGIFHEGDYVRFQRSTRRAVGRVIGVFEHSKNGISVWVSYQNYAYPHKPEELEKMTTEEIVLWKLEE